MRNIMLLGPALALTMGSGQEPLRNFDGPWARHTIDDSFRGADGVRVADVNHDGFPDVTAGWEQSGVTRAYLHPGVDAVKQPWPAVTVGATPGVEDAVWVDVDGDGHTDVVSCSEGWTRQVFVSFAPSDDARFLDPGAWVTAAVPAAAGVQWMFALPMDVDGRRGIDLVVGGKNGGSMIGWLESPHDPRDLGAWKLHKISDAGWVMSMDSADVNADGMPDVLVSDRSANSANSANAGVRWLEHPQGTEALGGRWTSHPIGAWQADPVFVAPVLGPDGSLHGVVVPSGRRRLALFVHDDASSGLWSARRLPYPHVFGEPKAAAVGDIDRDGIADVVMSSTNLTGLEEGLVWLSHAATRADVEPRRFSLSGAQGRKFDRVELLDLDADGDLDVLTTEEIRNFGVIWYENPLY